MRAFYQRTEKMMATKLKGSLDPQLRRLGLLFLKILHINMFGLNYNEIYMKEKIV
jgi:hypothetical protein